MDEIYREAVGNKHIKWGMIAVLFLLAAFLAVATIAGIKEFRYIGGGVPVSNTITVAGEGEVFAVPDLATFSFSVIEEAQTVTPAQETATEKINTLVAFLEGEGVEERDIRTIGYNVYPKYEFQRSGAGVSGSSVGRTEPAIDYFPPEGRQVIVGYEVRQTIEVKVRDTKRAGELLSGIGNQGASDISGLRFTIDDEDALRAEARSKAIEEAREKAKQLARELDVRLVRVVSFNENGFRPYAAREEALGMGGAFDTTNGTAVSAPSLPTGENRIVSNVNVTYEIR